MSRPVTWTWPAVSFYQSVRRDTNKVQPKMKQNCNFYQLLAWCFTIKEFWPKIAGGEKFVFSALQFFIVHLMFVTSRMQLKLNEDIQANELWWRNKFYAGWLFSKFWLTLCGSLQSCIEQTIFILHPARAVRQETNNVHPKMKQNCCFCQFLARCFTRK